MIQTTFQIILPFLMNMLFLTSCVFVQLTWPASWTSFSILAPRLLFVWKVTLEIWLKLIYFSVQWQLRWCKCTWNTFFIASLEWMIFHDQKALSLNFKGSPSQMFFKIDVLKNFVIFTGKHLCWSYFLIKLQASRPATLFKRDCNTGVLLWILRNF